jgi:hypothetical protein
VEDAEARIEELQQAAVDAGMDITSTQVIPPIYMYIYIESNVLRTRRRA